MTGFEGSPAASTAVKNPFDMTVLMSVTIKMQGWLLKVSTAVE